MVWYLNYYHCTECDTRWTDEWSCGCDDECPSCGSRNWAPCDSEDLTAIVDEQDGAFVVLHSPADADHKPAYVEVARFSTRQEAEAAIEAGRPPIPYPWPT